MFIISQLLILFLLFTWLASWIKNKWFRQLFIIAVTFAVGLEISSVYLTGQLVDDRFLKHTSINNLMGFGFQFKAEMGLFIAGWIVLILAMKFSAMQIQKRKPKGHLQAMILALLVAFMAWPNGILPPLWKSIQIAHADNENLDQALADLGMHPKTYTKPHQVTAKPGKNIIVISLESIEQGFLKPPYQKLTPNLTALSKQWTFFKQMSPMAGSDWTAGSLYTHQTGLPAFFNQQHFNNNHLFQNSQEFQLTSLNHVLKTAGYRTKYLIGKPEFAGIASILNTLEMDVISEQNSLGKYPKSQPGLHDKDLFSEAKLQIATMAKNPEQPFALFMSTINTHFPNGIMDERMQGMVPANDNPLEFLVSATDYLLNDFLQFIKTQGIADDTVIFIFPDHTLMGNSGEVSQTLNQNNRLLYLLSSAKPNTFSRGIEEPIFQIDLPKIILEGAEITTNANFLTDFIDSTDAPTFIEQNKLKIAAVNNAALSRKDYSRGFDVALEQKTLNIIGHDHAISLPVRMFKPTEIYQVTFSAALVPLEQEQISLNEAMVNDLIDPRLKLLYLQVHLTNGSINKITLGNRNGIELTKTGQQLRFTSEEIMVLNLQVDDQIVALKQNTKTTPLRRYAKDPERFIAHAGGAIDGHKYTNSLEALNHNYQLGFRLFELDIQQTADGQFVAVHDWPQWQKQTQYAGELPPSNEVFMQQTILQKYTAMDMTSINNWFSQHPDAILVTDKVNNPTEFAAKFIDNSRLMMELFTWSAVKTATTLDLKAVMPTGDLLFNIPGNPATQLKQLSIEYVVASRRWSESNQWLLRQLNNAGIKTFAFHIGFDKGKDEVHVVCKERAYFYGLYADQWDFQVPAENCLSN